VVRKFLGIAILLVVVAVTVVWQWQRTRSPLAVAVVGRVGGEKRGFLHNPEVQKYLQKRYGITVNAQRYGSVEMVLEPPTGQDFLWPASEVDFEYYRERGGALLQSRNLLHSPLVFYSWDVVTTVLMQHGMVVQRDESYYITDLPKLLTLVETRTSWAELGLPQLYGAVKVLATDPARSNSGNSFAGLLANLLNNGEVVAANDTARLDALLPRVHTLFTRMGFLEHSSGVLWDKFISQGAGAYPLIVGYENQLVEYGVEHSEALELLRQKVRTLYPVPTVWSSHPLIALTANGVRLLEALQDPVLQRLAWERHGFRSGLQGTRNDPQGLPVRGVPTSIEAVLPMPAAAVMARVLETVRVTP
jgi:hypothetical protein